MRANGDTRPARAFTLLELLLVIAIIALLASLLLPSLQRGQFKVKGLQCKNNLHQLGLGMLGFAHGHEDKFPVQVSTNQGGSSEFVDAGNAVNGEFFFAYKHFLPLSSELDTPKLLVCPADTRKAATNFSALRNTNVSYFISSDPKYGSSDSILSGDRNLASVSNSIARMRARPLKWNGEMHEYKGNVLFGDGHVEMLGNVPVQTAAAGQRTPSLVLPSAPRIPTPNPPTINSDSVGGGGGGGSVQGGTLGASFGSPTNLAALANGPLTNLTINSGPPRLPPVQFTGPGPDGIIQPIAMPTWPTQQTAVAPTSPATPEKSDEQEMQAAHEEMVDKGMELVKQGARKAYFAPWWLIVLLLVGSLWLLHRVHNRASSS